MKAKVYGIDGKADRSIDLPQVFEEDYRPDLIRKAFTAKQSRSLQPHGTDPMAGLRTSATYVGRRGAFRAGINKGIARLPRVKTGGGGLGEVRRVPHSKGGRRAHPPKIEKTLVKGINKKEQRLAMKSAISATANKNLVKDRGHKIAGDVPLVIEDKFEGLKKTSEVIVVLKKIGLTEDLERGKEKKIRAGKGTKRGRRYKRKKSALIVVSNDDALKACRNIPGIDAVKADKLNIKLLAPGSHAGRLTVWTEGAVKQVGEKYVINHPLVTEKAVDLIEKQNTLMFSVEEKATKSEIKKEVEKLYKVKVVGIRTVNSRRSGKRAFVKLAKENSASELATKLNMM